MQTELRRLQSKPACQPHRAACELRGCRLRAHRHAYSGYAHAGDRRGSRRVAYWTNTTLAGETAAAGPFPRGLAARRGLERIADASHDTSQACARPAVDLTISHLTHTQSAEFCVIELRSEWPMGDGRGAGAGACFGLVGFAPCAPSIREPALIKCKCALISTAYTYIPLSDQRGTGAGSSLKQE
jgi:hypothetical protein